MCGLVGIVGLQGAAGGRADELRVMLDTLHHRGPDALGSWTAPGIGLGHARLSIIDLATGQQPLANEDGTVQVVFNGEIFNYRELRADLVAHGHRFATASDTEVLVHAYEERGLAFVDDLVGQFAIALWDAPRRRLILARDRVGVRPLFWARVGDRIAFASEVKALFRLPWVPRAMDLRGVAESLTFWGPLAPRTPFQGISQLPPGHLLVVEAGGEPVVTRYWDWPFPEEPPRPRPAAEVDEELRARLSDAVALRLRADVEVAAYVSGGLDSSIIATLARRQGQPLRTFSIRFEDAEFDEGPYQDAVVSALGTDHDAALCRTEDVAAAFPRMLWHVEAPVVRAAPVPLMLLAERVRSQGIKVVLTGEGADEVFAGYDLFKEARLRRFGATHPGSSLPERLLGRLYGWAKTSPVRAPAFARAFFGQHDGDVGRLSYGHLPRWTSTARTLRFLSPTAREALTDFDPVAELEARLPASVARLQPLDRDQYLEAHTLLTGYLLAAQGDRVAMAHSVEGRTPFLDHRVIAFACGLPAQERLKGLDEKHVLKRAFGDLLPRAVTERTKQPYRAPDAASFFTEGKPRPWVADVLSEATLKRHDVLDATLVARLVEKCASGRATGFADNMALMGVLSTALLCEIFLGSAVRPFA